MSDETTEEITETPDAPVEAEAPDNDDLGGAVEMYAEALEEADESDAGAYGEGDDPEGADDDAPAPEAGEEADADEDALVQVSQKELNALLARLEAAAGTGEAGPAADAVEPAGDAEAEAAPEPEQAAAPETKPDFQFPDMALSEDDHYAIQSDHGAFNEYIQNVQAKTAEAVITQMQPMMMQSAMQVHAAMAFERQFFEENPELADYPELVNKAMLTAKAKNPGGSYGDWGKAVVEGLREVITIRKNLEKHGKPRDVRGGNRGRFAPASTRRMPGNPDQSNKSQDPTETALREIAGLEGSSEDLMRGLGVM